MALKQIMLQRKITNKKEMLNSLREKDAEFQKREKDLETAIEEAKTEEEQQVVEDEVNKFNEEKEPHDQQIQELEEEINSLEEELTQLNEKKPSNKGEERDMAVKQNTRAKTNTDYHERSDVKEFYNELRERLQMRANGQVLPDGPSGAELIIPDVIVNRIRERIGDFTTLYPLVDKVIAKGRVKLILDVDTSEATWLEMRGALPENDDSKLTAVEFDGFKIGRIVYIDNSLLEDSVINLDDYLTKRIARSIANCDQPNISIELNIRKMEDTALAKRFKKFREVGLFDTFDIFHERFKINITAQITKVIYDSLNERVESLEAGDTQYTFFEKQKQEISNTLKGYTGKKYAIILN